MKKFGTDIPVKLSNSSSSLSISFFCSLHYNYLLIFPTSSNMLFLKRDKKGDVYVGVMMGKN